MQSKLKIKIIKYHKNLFYVVIALNKKSIRSRFIDKIGVCFFRQQKKIIMLSLKKLSYWLNKGVKISNYISYIFSILFFYYLKNNKKNKLIFTNYNLKKNIKLNKNLYNNKIQKYLILKKKLI